MKKIIGMTMFLLGMVILLCFGENPEKPDGFGYVVALLLAGLALFGIGAWLAGLLDTKTNKNRLSRLRGSASRTTTTPIPKNDIFQARQDLTWMERHSGQPKQ